MIGRIYKLEGGGKFYIGSTMCDLKYRLRKHRSKSKEKVSEKSLVYTHFREIGWEHVTISEIDKIENCSRLELRNLETEYIKSSLDDINCLNKNLAYITIDEKRARDAEYGKLRRKSNPTYEKERLKKWRLENPEKYKEQYDRYNNKKQSLKMTKKEIA